MKELDPEKKWETVREFYQQSTPFRFKDRPSEEQVDMLYKKMLKLEEDIMTHEFQKPHLAKRLTNEAPMKIPEGE